MKFPSLVLLLGVCLLHATTAKRVSSGPYLLEINKNLLENVTLLMNTNDVRMNGIGLTGIARGAFDTITHIKTLDLSYNSIRILPPNIFSRLTNVEDLSLAHNRLDSQEFDESFVGLENLKRLDLSGNAISFLDSNSFIGLPNSAEVMIENSGFSRFRFLEYKVLRRFSRRFAEFKEIPKSSTVQLCMINGSVDSLSELKKNEEQTDDCITGEVKRRMGVISFSDSGLKSFRPNWYKLAAYDIREIDFSYNMIDITPELLNDLPGPLSIDLYDTGISRIKANIMENKNCMHLSFGGKSLQEIEDNAFEKLCLTQLSIDNSGLKDLDFVRTLPVLIEYLTVTNNKISEIPSDVFQQLNRLKILDLSFNKLKKIGRNMFSGLVHGFDIVLHHNEIDLIEEGSFSNVVLHRLNLNHNKITDESIHKGAFNFSHIEMLRLKHNLMESFNEELFSGILERCIISLHGNPIKHIKNLNYRKKITQ